MNRGEVVRIVFPTTQSHEQAGIRPALVVHSDESIPNLPTTVVIPFTGTRAADRFPHTLLIEPDDKNGLSIPSVLLVFQVRAIDDGRIRGRLGTLSDADMERANRELRSLLAFPED